MDLTLFGLLFLLALVWYLTPARVRKISQEVKQDVQEINREQGHKAAVDISLSLEKTFAEQHEIRVVDAATFRDRDLRFYDTMRRELEALGFRYVADIEDITLSAAQPAMRTFIRVMLSPDGTIVAAIYDARPRGLLISILTWISGFRQLKNVDMETELENGTFAATTTCPSLPLDTPAQIVKLCLAAKTSLADMIEAHRHQADAIAKEQNSGLRSFASLQDVVDSQARQHKILHDFRAGMGFGLSNAEKEKLGKGISKDLMKELNAEIDTLAENKKAQNE